MQYHIDTIPVWDALKSKAPCPICVLREKMNAKAMDFFLGASVMEPDIRVQVNRKGFCLKHQELLYAQKNRLGHALMLLSHANELTAELKKIRSKHCSGTPVRKSFFGQAKASTDSVSERIESLSEQCIVCDYIENNLSSYVYTILHLFKTDHSFEKLLDESNGFCFPDTIFLLRMAEKEFGAELSSRISSLLLDKLITQTEKTAASLEWFTLKFDYRNADKPWGDSKDAVDRMIGLLNGNK